MPNRVSPFPLSCLFLTFFLFSGEIGERGLGSSTMIEHVGPGLNMVICKKPTTVV